MELQFQKVQENCLQQLCWQVQQQEQTQELKIDDTMPDIGHVLGAWGQILIRGKEWQNGSVIVSGGVMVWTAYTPEEEDSCRCMETWIPFQIRCQIPPSERDGSICVSPLLRNVDARSISARKMMIRANVSVQVRAMVPGKAELYRPEGLPEDVQLLKKTYLTKLPREAGEKSFVIEDTLVLPGSCPALQTLVRYELQPELVDQKVMADKVIFRGVGLLHMLYLDAEGMLQSWDFEVPFSQYAELDQMYEEQATAQIMPALTSLELEKEEDGKLRLKAGMLGQYVVYDKLLLELVEDAYGTASQVLPQLELLELPSVLDETDQLLHTQLEMETQAGRVADIVFYPVHPEPSAEGTLELSGRFQVLYYDTDGMLSCETGKWTDQWNWPADSHCRVDSTVFPSGIPQAVTHANGMNLGADLRICAVCSGGSGMTMVVGLTVLPKEETGNRPGLILRRVGSDDLWQIAKETGSTVEKIKEANHLQDTPAADCFLLIPTT